MKRILLATCLMLSAGPANAQGIPTYDNVNFLQWIVQLKHDIATYALQGQQYAQQVQQAAMELQQLENFVHNPNIGAAMGLMNKAGLGNSLPVDPQAIAGMARGFGGVTSLSGILTGLRQLNGLVGQNFAANHVYTCTDASAACEASTANAAAIAGTQGAAQSAYQDYRKHMDSYQALRDRLATAGDMKDVADAQAQISLEQTWLGNQQGQMAAIDVNDRAQQRARVQRADESMDKSMDDFLAMADRL